MGDEPAEGEASSKIHELIGRVKAEGVLGPIVEALKTANEEERTAHNNSYLK